MNACSKVIVVVWLLFNSILGFIMLFLIHIKRDLYPYADIGGGAYPSIIDSDALASRILFSLLGSILGFFSLALSLYGFYQIKRPNKNIFEALIIFSVLIWVFFIYRYVELTNLSLWLDNCEKARGIFPNPAKNRSCD
ncbi:hypothetical protein NG798_25295 [Ancylothrix sp. C2]|uniref:hypothetical protein n=1 Tax=Ancylothrix sp. D3o TaxID=2953691 RepID=UPI0021BB48B8|nr:hypothetical protein [Ancylothrix sp. D3o]MCT7953118.1 hypothetical protein [Ancylothrix sp. D3o]